MKCLICHGEAKYWRDVKGMPTLRCVSRDCGFCFFDLAHWRSPYVRTDYYDDWVPRRIAQVAPYIQARVAIVRRFKEAGTVADLGCGIGETAIALGDAGFSVIGVEESAKAINFLGSQYPSIEWLHEDILEFLAKYPRSFDAITMFHVLEHIPHPANIIHFVDAALRADGVVVIEVPDVGGGLARLRGRRWDYFVEHHVNYFDVTSLQRLMASFGYRRRFLERTYHFSFPQGHVFKDMVKKTLANLGLNAIIRTAWTK